MTDAFDNLSISEADRDYTTFKIPADKSNKAECRTFTRSELDEMDDLFYYPGHLEKKEEDGKLDFSHLATVNASKESLEPQGGDGSSMLWSDSVESFYASSSSSNSTHSSMPSLMDASSSDDESLNSFEHSAYVDWDWETDDSEDEAIRASSQPFGRRAELKRKRRDAL